MTNGEYMQISSQFKYTVDLGVQATKATFRLKKTKKDTIMHYVILGFIVLMIGALIWDIVRGESFVINLILLIALVCAEIFDLVMPLIIITTQKKFLRKLNLAEIDYTVTEIIKDKCFEKYYKNNKIEMQNVCDMNKLVAYEIRDNYAFIVFNNFACAIFDLNTLTVSVEEFEKELNIIISKNKSTKSKRRI